MNSAQSEALGVAGNKEISDAMEQAAFYLPGPSWIHLLPSFTLYALPAPDTHSQDLTMADTDMQYNVSVIRMG